LNANWDVPTFHGILFRVNIFRNLTLKGLDVGLRLRTGSGAEKNGTVASPRVDVYYRRGPYSGTMGSSAHLTWYSNTTQWTRAYKGRATQIDASSGTPLYSLAAANFSSIPAVVGESISLYVTTPAGPFIDSTVDAMKKTGEPLAVGDDLGIDVGSGLTDPDFPILINSTVDPGFVGVVLYEIFTLDEASSSLSGCQNSSGEDHSGGNNSTSDNPTLNGENSTFGYTMATEDIKFPVLFSSNETSLTESSVRDVVVQILDSYLERHRDGTGTGTSDGATSWSSGAETTMSATTILTVMDNATRTVRDNMYVGLCPVEFDECPPPLVYVTTVTMIR
jgi:hypothetical protein